jgi:hypothetical protein
MYSRPKRTVSSAQSMQCTAVVDRKQTRLQGFWLVKSVTRYIDTSRFGVLGRPKTAMKQVHVVRHTVAEQKKRVRSDAVL